MIFKDNHLWFSSKCCHWPGRWKSKGQDEGISKNELRVLNNKSNRISVGVLLSSVNSIDQFARKLALFLLICIEFDAESNGSKALLSSEHLFQSLGPSLLLQTYRIWDWASLPLDLNI